MMRREKTSFQKKELFDCILYSELNDCKHKINARYEWRSPDQVLTVNASQKDMIELSINLNTGKQEHLRKIYGDAEMELRYRAYYISTYIRCLDDATTSMPQSYFSGLVLLCAINSLCKGRNVYVYSPIGRKKHDLRPIDAYCAIRALTRLSIDNGDKISENIKGELNGVISELLTYSMLPEISYWRGYATYSLLQEIRELQENVNAHRCAMTNYTFFNEVGIQNFRSISLNDLAIVCEKNQSIFWGNFLMRLSAHLGVHMDDARIQDPLITSCVRCFEEDSVKYYSEIKRTENLLLLDNFKAIKRLAQMSENVFSVVTANSGVLHYYQ